MTATVRAGALRPARAALELVLTRPSNNWPTATECSCGLVVGCGLSSSTHELGSAWHQCRQRDARAGFEPAISRGCWPCGIPLPHPALCPDISRRGGIEKARGSLWDSRAAVWELRPLFGLPFPHVSCYGISSVTSSRKARFVVLECPFQEILKPILAICRLLHFPAMAPNADRVHGDTDPALLQ